MLANFQHLKSIAHKDMQDLTDPQTDEPTHEYERTTVCLRCTVHPGIMTMLHMKEALKHDTECCQATVSLNQSDCLLSFAAIREQYLIPYIEVSIYSMMPYIIHIYFTCTYLASWLKVQSSINYTAWQACSLSNAFCSCR